MSVMVTPKAQSGLFNTAVAATLRGEAAVQHLSYKDLAAATGLAPKTVSRYLTDDPRTKRVIPIDALYLIAVRLGTLPSEVALLAEGRMARAESNALGAETTQSAQTSPPVRADITDGSEITEVDPALQVQLDEIDATTGLTKRHKAKLKDQAQRDYQKPQVQSALPPRKEAK